MAARTDGPCHGGTAAAIAPPMLEFATCCISMMSGNTSEMPANAFGPNRPMKCASTDAVTAMSTTLTTIFGGPRRGNIKTIGPCRRARVREAVPWVGNMPALELAIGMLSFVIDIPCPEATGAALGGASCENRAAATKAQCASDPTFVRGPQRMISRA
jgi:hypothetical protein